MKVYLVFTLCLVLGSAASVAKSADDTVIKSSVDEGELDEFSAKTLEVLGAFLNDNDDDEDGDDQDELHDHILDDDDHAADEVITATVDEDGMIEVEDMIVSPELFEVMFPHDPGHHGNTGANTTVHRRAALASKSKFWPKGRIAYSYSKVLKGDHAKIRAAMDEWEKKTCLKFEYRKKGETKYVLFRTQMTNTGQVVRKCSSALGYSGKRQYINLAAGCFAHKVLLHEIGHTLGLIHEHQHPNRDKYVTINWTNVVPSKKHNFNSRKGISTWGIKYDPNSIMHYRSTSFRKSSCKGSCSTITSKAGAATTKLMGRSKHLSEKSDVPIIKKIYGCPA